MSVCRECAAPIRFVRLDTGRALPVDPAPVVDGNVAAVRAGGHLIGYVLSHDKPMRPLHLRYMPHHATCPARAEERAHARTPKKPEPDNQQALF